EAVVAAGTVAVGEGEGEHHPAWLVCHREGPLAEAGDVAEASGLEFLLRARRTARVDGRRLARADGGGHVGRAEAVLDADAIVGERVVAMAVVALEPGEIGVGDAAQVLARRARAGIVEPPRIGTAARVELRRAVAEPADAAEQRRTGDDRLDLADPLALRLDPQREDRARASFGDRDESSGLAGRLVAKRMPVGTDRIGRRPEPLADGKFDAVFRVPGAGKRGRLARGQGGKHVVDQVRFLLE